MIIQVKQNMVFSLTLFISKKITIHFSEIILYFVVLMLKVEKNEMRGKEIYQEYARSWYSNSHFLQQTSYCCLSLNDTIQELKDHSRY